MTQGSSKTNGSNSGPGPVVVRSLDPLLGKLWTATDGWELVIALALYMLTTLADELKWLSPEMVTMAYDSIKYLFGVAVVHKVAKGAMAAKKT